MIKHTAGGKDSKITAASRNSVASTGALKNLILGRRTANDIAGKEVQLKKDSDRH